MAKYNKKRAKELQHDKFRDTTMNFVDRVGVALEGKGRTILYALGGLIVLAALALVLVRWNARKNDEAQQALGRAINLTSAPVAAGGTPPTPNGGITFGSEQERAQRSIVEFEKVAAKYGDPYRTEAQYFIATNRLSIDRAKGMSELAELTKSGDKEVASLSKFALAQAKESDGKFDEAAQLYIELARNPSSTISADSANLRLAKVYSKQGKKKEASDLLFNIVDASRKAKGKDDSPSPTSGAAREAATELQKIDPDRFAQLPPEAPSFG